MLQNPANTGREITLTPQQFRYAFGNAVTEPEGEALYDAYQAPVPGRPIFQAAAANLNPWPDASVHADAAQRGPLLVVSQAAIGASTRSGP